MKFSFSDRIEAVRPSFIREILKLTSEPGIISFAGGIPNPDLFPREALQEASMHCFQQDGSGILQYATTEGYAPLREYIARRYRDQQGLDIDAGNILITNGSQQGLDLLGKVLLNEGDDVVLEEPGYLGAIQAFSVYRARLHGVEMDEEGIGIEALADTLSRINAKLLYCVPNFQNPSGVSYSDERRRQVADTLRGSNTLLVEDDPYGDIRFEGQRPESFASLLPEQTILLGSFSKTVVPAFRLGWIVAPVAIMEKLVIVKQAADLHSNYFSQRVLHRYLLENDLDQHIGQIVEVYGRQRDAMIKALDSYMPETITHTHPAGGMFVWATLPEHCAAMDLFELAIKDQVAFVPGDPFYVDGQRHNTLRLSFTTVDEDTIEEGIRRLANSARTLLASSSASR